MAKEVKNIKKYKQICFKNGKKKRSKFYLKLLVLKTIIRVTTDINAIIT